MPTPSEPGRTGTTRQASVAHPRSGLGIAALVLGIVAIVASGTMIGGIVLGIIAVILGVLARSRTMKGQATRGGVALAGIITGASAWW